MDVALERGFIAAPVEVLIHMMHYLIPYPDRSNASSVCIRWHEASYDKSFLLRVLPIESGIRDAFITGTLKTLEKNTFISISDAIKVALPGNIISIGVGHHWETKSLIINIPLKIISECKGRGNEKDDVDPDPSRCILEINGSLQILSTTRTRDVVGVDDNNDVSSVAVVLCGITIRHPRKVIMSIDNNNTAEYCPCIVLVSGKKSTFILLIGEYYCSICE